MAWGTPTTASGQVLTSAIWNASVRDNLQYLYDYGPNRAVAAVSHSTTQSIANTTSTALIFNTESVDAFGMHTASGSRLTVPTSWGGWWLVRAYFAFASNATGYRQGVILANGANVVAAQTTPATNGTAHDISVSALVYLTATQYVEAFCSQSSGGALNVSTGALFQAIWLAKE